MIRFRWSVLVLTLCSAAAASQTPADSVVQRVVATDITGSLSAMGEWLSYTDWSTGDIAIRNVVTGRSRRITNKGSWFESPEHGFPSVMSADGRYVAYSWVTRDGLREIRVAHVDSAVPRTIYRSGRQHSEPKAWTQDGAHLLVATEGVDDNAHVILLGLADGTTAAIATLPGYDLHLVRMSFHPNGRAVAFDLTADSGSRARDVVVLSLADGSVDRLKHDGNDVFLVWSPVGDAINFASERDGTWSAMYVPWDGRGFGAPRVTANGIGPVIRALGAGADGRIYVGRYEYANHLYVASLGAAGTRLAAARRVARLGGDAGAAWARDGRDLAYVTGFGYPPDPFVLRVREMSSGSERAFTLPFGAHPFRLSWSASGDCILAHEENRRGRHAVHCVDPRTGRVTNIVPLGQCCFESPTWSPNGDVIMRRRSDVSDRGRIVVVSRDTGTGRERELYVTTPPTRVPDISDPIMSPDARRLALIWASWQEGASVVRVVSLADSAARDIVRVTAPREITAIAWMPDARSIVYAVASEGADAELWLASVDRARPRRIGSIPERTIYSLSVNPAGDRVALSAGTRGWEDTMWRLRPLR